MWLPTLLALCASQADAGVGLATPPLPHPLSDLPRVTRVNGKVCVEALDGAGVIKTECRDEGTPWSAPRLTTVAPRAGPRAVASLNLGLGVLTGVGLTAPEAAFLVDAGVLFPNGVGIVGLAHAHLSPVLASAADVILLHRYGLGAALRLGTRSHFLLGLTGTLNLVQDLGLRASPAVSLVLKGALVVLDSFAILLLPVFGFDEGVTFSLSAGIGASL